MIITISREAATNGGLIGHLVGERLHLPVFDRELVDEIARRLQVEPSVITHFDETTVSPVASLLWEWRSSVNEQIYRRYLTAALQRIAKEQPAVIVGRGANFVLRCAECLHVRIVAPLPLRVAIFQATHEVTVHEAEKAIHQEDHDRAHFVKSVYNAVIGAPENYDLVLNLSGLTPEMAAEIIAQAAEIRSRQHLPPEPAVTLPEHITQMMRHHRPVRREIVERQTRGH